MKREELTKTFMMIENNPLFSMVYIEKFSALMVKRAGISSPINAREYVSYIYNSLYQINSGI